jgi:rhodanese-related sulfurtransferase
MSQLSEYIAHHPLLVAVTVVSAAALVAYELHTRRLGTAAVGTQDAVRLMNQGAAVLDVRSSEEFAAGHLGNARHAPPESLDLLADSLKRFKDKPVLVYCERGGKAAAAIARLRALGFKQVFNLRGGVAAWRTDNLPLVK